MHLGDLLTAEWPDDRVVVGRRDGHLVALDRGQPLLVVGPPRAGKTSALVIPNVARWGGSVVATSIRSDVLDVTAARRAATGEVRVFDPTGTVSGAASGHLDFLGPCTDYDVACRTAKRLVGYMHYEGVRDQEFWRTSATRLLGVLLFAGAHSAAPLDAVLAWLTTSSSPEVVAALEGAGNAVALRTYRNIAEHASESFVASVQATAVAAMQTYEDSRVARAVQRGGLDPDRFLAGGANTLFLCLPPDEQRMLAPYSALVVDRIVAAQHRRARRPDPRRAPLLLALDEAMNIAPLEDLAVLASTAAGTGIQLVTVAHDFSQIVGRYGDADAHTIVANHSLLLLGGGLREHTLGALIDRLVDPGRIPEGADWTGTASEWVRRLAPSQALLVHRHLPATVVELTPWFEDPVLVVDHLEALFALEPAASDHGPEPEASGDGADVSAPEPAATGHEHPARGADPRVGEWSRFECGATGVSARFPASPRYERTPGTLFGDRHVLEHASSDWSVALSVTEIADPAFAGTTEVFEHVAASLAGELRADLLTIERRRLGEHDAVDADLVGPTGDHTHLLVTGTTTCLVAASIRARAPARDMFTEFAETLEIVPAPFLAGESVELRLDRSGRLTVPVAVRSRLARRLVIAIWDGAVRVFTGSAFDTMVAELRADGDPDRRPMLRSCLASSASTRMDGRGRLYLPERFRRGTGIGLVVRLTVTDDGFELRPLG